MKTPRMKGMLVIVYSGGLDETTAGKFDNCWRNIPLYSAAKAPFIII